MTTTKNRRREYEDRERGSGTPVLILAAVALFGLAVLMLYIALASPTQGAAMGAIHNVLRGLGGSLTFAVPLVLVWGGVLCLMAARGKRVSPLRVIADGLLIVCLFTAVHLFSVQRIMDERMTIISYSNFVDKSYSYGGGGGAIGALLAWPLYDLGLAGGLIAVLIVALLLLTATGRTSRFVYWVQDQLDAHAENKAVRDEERAQRAEERREREERRSLRAQDALFETNARSRAAASKGPSRDPFSETVLSGAPEQRAKARSTGRTGSRAAEGPMRPAEAAGATGATGATGSTGAKRRGQGTNARNAAASEDARRQGPDPIEDAFDALDAVTRPAPRKRPARTAEADVAAPAQSRGKKPAARRGKLYNEEVSEAEAFEAAPAQPVQPARGDEILDVPDLDAQSILQDKPAKGARKGFKPDRPSLMEEPMADEAARPAKVVKADKSNNVKLDDLLIEPDQYESPDDDEAPFDTVEGGIAEKKRYPKLKRVQSAPEPDAPVYNYPPIDLLAQGDAADNSGYSKRDMEKAQQLEDTLHSFGISSKLIGIAHGPAVTRFELQPAPGVKVSRITNLSDDIALNLAALSVRIEAPIPGKAAVGVEIPNDKIEMVRLRDVLESQEARKHPSKIAVGLGKDNSGRYIVADIAKMPHVLIAGQTGSGKSVCINAIITSILFRSSPEEVKLILIDPKVVELSIYNDIPHLVCPVVTDPKKAASALDWAVAEMSSRYKKFAERGVRDIKGYNKALKEGEPLMPQMVIIIDELADLMMVSPGEVEDSICRLAQLARACGMHLVIATQRPSVNVITGIIKANIPTRIAFSVASQVDSRTMIDHGGAEKLLGNGDMLFLPNGSNKPMRVQGAWVSDDEVHAIVEYIKASGQATYDPDMLEHLENAVRSDAEKEEFAAEYDPKLAEAVDIVLDMGQASISMLQRRMRIGYARAGRLIDEMAQRGIVSEADGAKPRVVLITREQANAMFEEGA